MQNKNQIVVNHKIIPELVSRSSTHAITQQQALKTLKKFQGLSCFITARGFTLIELLVVVLIIGILAAVAVPQYQKAVRKARIAEAKVILKQLTDAQDVWYLTSDTAPAWEELDVEIPTETKNWSFYTDECASDFNTPGNNGLTGCANYATPKWESGYLIGYASPNYNSGVTDFSGHFICTTDETICTGLGGVQSEDWGDTYILP